MPDESKKIESSRVSTDAPGALGVAKAERRSINFKPKKVFLGYEEGDNPELEPTFANHFELFVVGSDLFLDVGMVKPEELIEAATVGTTPSSEPVELPFYVTHRIAMSYDTFSKLHVKINEIYRLYQTIRNADSQDKTN
jgi:hypothetical protein